MYEVSVAGTTNLDGISSWVVGDFALFNGDRWRRISTLDGGSGVDFDTRTAAAGATIPLTVNVVTTGGFAVAGDGGQGLYKRMAVAPVLTTNPGYFRSVDRFTSAGAVDSVNGGWWQLVPQGGVLFIEQFAGKADFNGTTGTDNQPALMAAMGIVATVGDVNNKYTLLIQFGTGKYYFGQMLDFNSIVNIRGWGGATEVQGQGEATQFWFPSGITCMVFQNFGTGPGEDGTTANGHAAGSTIEGFSVHQMGSSTDWTKSGVKMRCRMTMRRVSFYNLCGHGVYVLGWADGVGANKGGPNGFRIENCFVHSCKYHALRVRGGDANAGTIINWETHGSVAAVDGCGILDESQHGNNYYGSDIAGFGNKGLSYGSPARWYILVSNTSGVGGATTPGTNPRVWYDIGAEVTPNANFPTWVSGGNYGLNCPIACFGNVNTSVFVGQYVETSFPSTLGDSQAIAYGGQIAWTRQSTSLSGNDGVAFSTRGFSSWRQYQTGSLEYVAQGASAVATFGTSSENDIDRFDIFTHSRGKDAGQTWRFSYSGNDLSYVAGDAQIWRITTAATTEAFGTSAPIPYQIIFTKIAFSDLGGNNPRRIGYSDSVPTTGNWARGDRLYHTNPSAGSYEGWVCVSSGTPGTWKTFGSIAA